MHKLKALIEEYKETEMDWNFDRILAEALEAAKLERNLKNVNLVLDVLNEEITLDQIIKGAGKNEL